GRTQPISFEIFPPKGNLTLDTAHAVASELAELVPDFISVTYSAAGSGNAQSTSDVAAMIQNDFDIPAVAHLTCINQTEATLSGALDDLKAKRIDNVLALRGDPIPGRAPSDFL